MKQYLVFIAGAMGENVLEGSADGSGDFTTDGEWSVVSTSETDTSKALPY